MKIISYSRIFSQFFFSSQKPFPSLTVLAPFHTFIPSNSIFSSSCLLISPSHYLSLLLSSPSFNIISSEFIPLLARTFPSRGVLSLTASLQTTFLSSPYFLIIFTPTEYVLVLIVFTFSSSHSPHIPPHIIWCSSHQLTAPPHTTTSASLHLHTFVK